MDERIGQKELFSCDTFYVFGHQQLFYHEKSETHELNSMLCETNRGLRRGHEFPSLTLSPSFPSGTMHMSAVCREPAASKATIHHLRCLAGTAVPVFCFFPDLERCWGANQQTSQRAATVQQ